MKHVFKPLLVMLGLALSSTVQAEISTEQQDNLARYVENNLERQAYAKEYEELIHILETPGLSAEDQAEIEAELELYVLKAQQLREEAVNIALEYKVISRKNLGTQVGVFQIGCEAESAQYVFGTQDDLDRLSRAAAVFQAKQKLDTVLASVAHSSDFSAEEFSRWVSLIGQEDSSLINARGEFQLDELLVIQYQPSGDYAEASNGGVSTGGIATAEDRARLDDWDTQPTGLGQCYGISYPWSGGGDCLVGELTVCDNIFSRPECLSCTGVCIDIFGPDETCDAGCSWLGFPGCACRE